ncbi:hypothetical protein ACO1MN_15520, partial [Staphylococcus aureus]
MKLPPERYDEPEWVRVQRRLQFNDAGREIWFGRILWSYYPAHWKGLAVMLAGIAATLCLVVVVDP